MAHVLEVKDLKTEFTTDRGIVKAVDGVSFFVNKGEIVAIVGESGSGKSVSQLSVLKLIPTPPGKIVSGEITFQGIDISGYKEDSAEMREIRGGKIGMIFQEPMTSLNPVLTVGQQIIESLRQHLNIDETKARKRTIELLQMVGISDASQKIDSYPHEFSGGMRQRAMIAMALSCNPDILIADEPTTALDVTTQAQLFELLQNMVVNLNISLLIVTHNLGVVARYAQRIYVMYAGHVVESGTSNEIFGNPSHPYTIGLLKAVPRLDEPKVNRLVPIDGLPPNLINMAPHCAFLPRCPYHSEECRINTQPELRSIGGQHYISCHKNILERQATDVSKLTVTAPKGPVGDLDNKQLHEETTLEITNLKMSFPVTKGILRRIVGETKVLDDVSLKIKRGEVLGLVGESGCGKTTVTRCIFGLYHPTAGHIKFEGSDITGLSPSKMRPFRRNMSLVFQDPYSSLDPRQSAGSIVGEPLKVHRLVNSKGEYQDRLDELFQLVGLDPSLKDRFPHEFSGGQRQRIGIARALASNPSFIVCDEPVSALDVSIQAQIINLLEELKQKINGLTYLFIAHDLAVVRHISDRIVVMYLGRIVEIADWESLYEKPLHPYTQALLSAVPIPDALAEEKRERIVLRGEVPSIVNRPSGCNFHPRCLYATKECSEIVPPLINVDVGHEVACIRVRKIY